MLTITSPEALDAAVSECVRLKLAHTTTQADLDTAKADLEKRWAVRLGLLADKIAASEGQIAAYCTAHRAELFPVNKSRVTVSAVIGFEWTPWRVETSAKRITWKNVVVRLLATVWGGVYVRRPEPQVDKNALLADRERLRAEQQAAVGITFARDEQFFIRPNAETADSSTIQARQVRS